MPSITYDGRTFMLDGRRLWLASGSIHFQRLPRDSWAHRLSLAARAGLNCVETPVFWNRVEARPGQFDFSGDNDIAAFCKLAAAQGLYVILRPGPYVGSGWDLGGLPAWLLDLPEVKLRTANAPFLEAVGRYFTALAKEVKSLQATARGTILLVQTEHHWTCGHDALGQAYLGELTRYLREAGFAVPRINANNLWQGVEGDIDCWAGDERMLSTMRQFGAVRPDQPRLVAEFGIKARPAFGAEAPTPASPVELQRRLGEIVAGGGQFNISPFVCGTSFGFWGGQSSIGEHSMLAPTQDLGAPVDECGRPTQAYRYVRRLATFVTGFARVITQIEQATPLVSLDPSGGQAAPGKPTKGAGWTVVPTGGAQGSVVWLFAPGGKPVPGVSVDLLLPDGSTLPVPTGQQAVQWCLFNVSLSSRSVLDYTSLCPLFAADDLLVCFGPAGAVGRLSINGTPIEVEVPKGRKPAVVVHEDVTVVVVSEDLADETFLTDSGVYVGAASVDAAAGPVGPSRSCTLVARDGTCTSVPCGNGAPPVPRGRQIDPEVWKAAPALEHADGSSPRYAQIPGPANLPQLGSPYGYGWYRVTVRSGKPKRFSLGAPEACDRLQIILDGTPLGVLGRGPGAVTKLTVNFSKGEHTIVALADNMGRIAGGSDLSERHGLTGHFYELTPFKAGRAGLVEGPPIDLLGWRSPLMWLREGDATHPQRLTWAFQHRRATPVFVELPPLRLKAAVVLNDQPVAYIDAHRSAHLTLTGEMGLKRGNNTFQLAAVPEAFDDAAAEAEVKEFASAVAAGSSFFEGASVVSETASWAFAKWEMPHKTTYEEVARSALGKFTAPTWWRTTFDAVADPAAPLVLDLSGMTKGQVYLNGNNLGRYFLQTHEHKKVPPIHTMPLPAPWLKDKGNELVLFDEHGGNPGRVKLTYE